MNKKVKELLDSLDTLKGKQLSDRFNQWRSQNPQIKDFSNIIFDEYDLTGTHLNNLNLKSCVFKNCKLANSNFNGSDVENCVFLDNCIAANSNFSSTNAQSTIFMCNLDRANFSGANLENANFSGSSLRRSDFKGALLRNSSLLNVIVDGGTIFSDVSTVEGCKIDKYTIECLSLDCGLTTGNKMDMEIIDDVAKLRSQFGGIWTWIHLFSLIIFSTPYIWFLGYHWTFSREFHNSDNQNSITLIEALMRYIVSGGSSVNSFL